MTHAYKYDNTVCTSSRRIRGNSSVKYSLGSFGVLFPTLPVHSKNRIDITWVAESRLRHRHLDGVVAVRTDSAVYTLIRWKICARKYGVLYNTGRRAVERETTFTVYEIGGCKLSPFSPNHE